MFSIDGKFATEGDRLKRIL